MQWRDSSSDLHKYAVQSSFKRHVDRWVPEVEVRGPLAMVQVRQGARQQENKH